MVTMVSGPVLQVVWVIRYICYKFQFKDDKVRIPL